MRSSGRVDQPSRLRHGGRPAIRLAQELGLERQVDGTGRDIEGELLRLEVVLRQGHRERERDPAAESVCGAGEPAIDCSAGKRTPGSVQARHAEQAQQCPLLPQCRGRAGTRTPRAGERLGAVGELVDRLVSH